MKISRKIVDEVLQEWWSGKTSDGRESKFVNFVDYGGLLGKQRRVDIDVLCGQISRRLPSESSYSVRLAVGVDGEPDVRVWVEIRKNDKIEESLHVRWRPPTDEDLWAVYDRGVRVSDSWRVTVIEKHASEVQRWLGVDTTKMDLSETAVALEILKREMFDVLDMIEAGSTDAADYLKILRTQESKIRRTHDDQHAQRKEALVKVSD